MFRDPDSLAKHVAIIVGILVIQRDDARHAVFSDVPVVCSAIVVRHTAIFSGRASTAHELIIDKACFLNQIEALI